MGEKNLDQEYGGDTTVLPIWIAHTLLFGQGAKLSCALVK